MITNAIRIWRTARAILLPAVLLAGYATADVSADEIGHIAEALRLEPGMDVADVGAGDGEWVAALVERVGTSGHVWATEVDDSDLGDIRRRMDDLGFDNVATVLGDQDDTGLPESCCDAILLRMVYHHFVRPERMRDSLYRSLRPEGRLAIIDILPQEHWRKLPDVPDRGGHGILPDEVIAEMTSQGFVLLDRVDEWDGDEERFCLVFGR